MLDIACCVLLRGASKFNKHSNNTGRRAVAGTRNHKGGKAGASHQGWNAKREEGLTPCLALTESRREEKGKESGTSKVDRRAHPQGEESQGKGRMDSSTRCRVIQWADCRETTDASSV